MNSTTRWLSAVGLLGVSACAAHRGTVTTVPEPVTSAGGVSDANNEAAMTALVSEVKSCWAAHPEQVGDEGCPPIEKIRVLYSAADTPARVRIFITTMNWLSEPSDWRYRRVAASVLPSMDDGKLDTLARVLGRLHEEKNIQTPMRAFDNLRPNLADYAGHLAAKLPGLDGEVLAFAKETGYLDPDARASFLVAVGPSERPQYFETLLTLARNPGESDGVRRAAIAALSEYTGAAQKPVVGALLLELARSDAKLPVRERAVFAYKGYGVADEAKTLVAVVTQSKDPELKLSGIVTLGALATNATGPDRQSIVGYALKLASDGAADGHSRALAIAILRDLKVPRWKKLATQLARSKNPELAKEGKDLLKPKDE